MSRVFSDDESSSTLACNTEKDKSRLHFRSAGKHSNYNVLGIIMHTSKSMWYDSHTTFHFPIFVL